MDQNRLRRGPERSHAAQRGQNGLTMSQNTPKWPFPGQICLSLHRRGTRGWAGFSKKKVCKKRGQKGNTGFFDFWPCFTHFTHFTYFGPHIGVRGLNLGLRAKPRGLKAARRWDGDKFGTAAYWGPATHNQGMARP